MPSLDQLKEQVAYMKFWQGVMVVTNNRNIDRYINRIGKL
jgi:hypothetical protein